MAYADQQMSGNRITALIIVALIHIVLGYALVTGLAFEGAKSLVKKLTTVDIKEEVKKDEPPPPPKKEAQPPPIVAPPPMISLAPPPPISVVTSAPPPVVVVTAAFTPAATVAPAAKFTPKSPTPKGNPGSWQSSDDYPSGPLRKEQEGVAGFRVTVGADGRVSGCSITRSSGSPELDSATCSLITRRGRFNPATDGEGKPTTGSWGSSVRWQIPKD